MIASFKKGVFPSVLRGVQRFSKVRIPFFAYNNLRRKYFSYQIIAKPCTRLFVRVSFYENNVAWMRFNCDENLERKTDKLGNKL